jgi:hypothetical protein
MPTINQLASISQVNGSAQIPVYDQNNGDARKMSVNTLLDYFQTSFAAPTVATNLYTPGAGFNITVPTPVAEQQWMLIQPAGTLATGTVTLPLNTGVPDGTEVLITSTQTITAFTIALNGAAAIFGNVSTLTAGAAVRYRYYLATNSWYNITNETAGFNAAIQTFLNNPTSANLRAAMTDETGTGLLVFNTTPTLVTPVLGAATGTSLVLSGAATAATVAVSNVIGTTAVANTLGITSNVLATPKDINFVAAGLIKTITVPSLFVGAGGAITLIPTAAFTWDASGNIALPGTAVVGRPLTMTYDGTTQKFYPSYTGSVQDLIGPGAVNLTSITTAFSSTAAGNALTLADGAEEQFKTIIYYAELAGGDTGILTPANLGSATTITFNAVGDSVSLQFIAGNWWVVGFRGAVVA